MSSFRYAQKALFPLRKRLFAPPPLSDYGADLNEFLADTPIA
jgi:hypothetical protein